MAFILLPAGSSPRETQRRAALSAVAMEVIVDYSEIENLSLTKPQPLGGEFMFDITRL